jgi:antitoxin HigA-1
VEFVSPLHPACEHRFRFDLNGNIAAVANHPSALATIQILALDHESLTEDRKRVIEEFIYGPQGDDPLSPANAQRALQAICNQDRQGRFYEFCIAIRDALEAHVRAIRRLAQRWRAARRTTSWDARSNQILRSRFETVIEAQLLANGYIAVDRDCSDREKAWARVEIVDYHWGEMMTKRDFPPIHPGEILLEDFLKPMQISQYHLAQAIGVPPRRINEIVHGKRGITADTALRLGRFFGMEAQFWMNLQTRYDLETTREALADRLDQEVRVHVA